MRSLTRHTRATHLGKTFKCQKCDKSFTRTDALIRHGHQHRQLVTHKCDKCLKEFYRRDKLVEHYYYYYYYYTSLLKIEVATNVHLYSAYKIYIIYI
jgi:uncharacterized Zn-finger protein